MRRAIVALALLLAAGTVPSGATYTASSGNPQGFAAAADFGLHVTMVDPGTNRKSAVPLAATASQTGGGSVSQVVIQRSPANADTWTTVCTITTPPYSCDWTTTANGLYDFRARATNSNGYTRTSAVVEDRLIDTTAPSATVVDPGDWFRATLRLRANVDDGSGSGVASVTYQYKASLAGTWTTACTASAPPFECDFPTDGVLTNGLNYDFRVVATDAADNQTTSPAVVNRRPDNLPPSGGISLSLTLLRATVTLGTALPLDLHSGVASVTMQYSVAGANSWSSACVATASPWSCDWDTTLVTSQLYDLRLVIADVAGNTATSTVLAGRRVDNILPTVSLTNPASPLSGTINLSASASDSESGVKDVAFYRSPAGAATWTAACGTPDTTGPSYTCSFGSTTLPDALYDFRALATDNAGNAKESIAVNRRIDNFAPSGADVQTANGGATVGVIEAGDSITLTYSEEIDPSSIIAGWDGTGTRNVFVTGSHHNQGDRLMFLNGTSPYPTIPLAASPGVDLNADFFANNSPAWAATLTRSGKSFTVTFGGLVQGGPVSTTPATAAAMDWFPANGARDFLAKASSTTSKPELGASDRDF